MSITHKSLNFKSWEFSSNTFNIYNSDKVRNQAVEIDRSQLGF